jgi:hypothetical protein
LVADSHGHLNEVQLPQVGEDGAVPCDGIEVGDQLQCRGWGRPRHQARQRQAPDKIPPAWVLPCAVKDNLGTVTVHQGGIHIERTRAGRINGNHSADISCQELAGIDFLEPNFFRNGHVTSPPSATSAA